LAAVLDDERVQVASAARRLAAAGLVLGTAGNLSARAGDHVAITATGAELAALEPDEVVVVDLDGRVVAGRYAPTSEIALHLGAYRRYGAGAVVHTHAPAATAMACVLQELPVIHYQMLALGGAVRVAPYATFGTPALAELTLDALDGRCAVLMSNHGTLTTGAGLDAAVQASLLLEWASELYRRAAAVGPPRVLTDAEIAAYRETMAARGYGALRGVAR
jgi:L-fuculose-phosphate aldolase